MSPTLFYREQAALQKRAADGAVLENVRIRCQRAADAWTELADRAGNTEAARRQAGIDKASGALPENAAAAADPQDQPASGGPNFSPHAAAAPKSPGWG